MNEAELMRQIQDLQAKVRRMEAAESLAIGWRNYTATCGGFSAAPTVLSRYILIGKLCTVSIEMTAAGTSNATTFTVSSPFTAATIAGMEWGSILRWPVNAGAVLTAVCPVWISSAGTTFALYTSPSGGAWTNSGDKRAHFTICYEVA